MSSNLLHVHDILFLILWCLRSDTATLLRASLVNSTWFRYATEVLWSQAEGWELMKVERSRRQIYASKMQSLHLVYGNLPDSLRSLAFPRLKYLRTNCSIPDGSRILVDQYFSPSLETLVLLGGNLARYLLDYTSFDLPKLRRISIYALPQDVDAGQLLSCLQKFPSLSLMDFGGGINRAITDRTLGYLMSQPSLVELDLCRPFGQVAIEKSIALAITPFINLKSLDMAIESNSIPFLVPAISNGKLQNLSLDIHGKEGSILDYISTISHLQSLRISYRESREIPRTEIIALRRLNQLYIIEFNTIDKSVLLQSLDTHDEDIQQLAAQLRQLRRFFFNVRCNLSVKAMVEIGKSCLTLEDLELQGEFDLLALEHVQEVLFPALRDLQLCDTRARFPQDQLVFPSCSIIF